MKKARTVVWCILIWFSATAGGVEMEKLTPEKRAALKELMDLTGASHMSKIFGEAFIRQMSNSLRRARPDIDPRAFDILRQEVMAVMREELDKKGSLQALIYPIYNKYLTLDETRALIRFYRTPLGKKTIEVMPKMTREAMMVGQRWGQQLAPRIQERVLARFRKEGIILPAQDTP